MLTFNRNVLIFLLCGVFKSTSMSNIPWDRNKFQINLNNHPGIYSKPNLTAGKMLKEAYRNGQLEYLNADEIGPYYEGDILMTHLDPIQQQSPHGRILKSNVSLWPNATIPYEIARNVYSNVRAAIHRAIEAFERESCLRFIPRKHENEYISFESEQHSCFSNVGRKLGAKTIVNLQDECIIKLGSILHEMMHALGFLHEHNRYDRDDYIIINWRNIIKSRRSHYNIYRKEETIGYDVPYDLRSLMHYSMTGNAIRSTTPVIYPIKDDIDSVFIGQRTYFSRMDVKKLTTAYCPNNTHFSIRTTWVHF